MLRNLPTGNLKPETRLAIQNLREALRKEKVAIVHAQVTFDFLENPEQQVQVQVVQGW